MNTESIITERPPSDGREWDCQCARCGSSVTFEDCGACGGYGRTEPGELHEMDPLWYHPGDQEACPQCGGDASYALCLSSPDWCQANPIAGRENIERGQVEWFALPERHDLAKRPDEL